VIPRIGIFEQQAALLRHVQCVQSLQSAGWATRAETLPHCASSVGVLSGASPAWQTQSDSVVDPGFDVLLGPHALLTAPLGWLLLPPGHQRPGGHGTQPPLWSI
jgi:hypothetical protein